MWLRLLFLLLLLLFLVLLVLPLWVTGWRSPISARSLDLYLTCVFVFVCVPFPNAGTPALRPGDCPVGCNGTNAKCIECWYPVTFNVIESHATGTRQHIEVSFKFERTCWVHSADKKNEIWSLWYRWKMNNYFDYLCCVYNICFESKNSLHSDKLAIASNQFYDHSFVSQTTKQSVNRSAGQLNVLAVTTRQPLSTTDKSLKSYKNEWDVVPRTCQGGDWLMRYSENETNFHPWSVDAKFSHFELVPWRQQRSRVDLVHDEGWDRTTLTDESEQNLRKLQKFETKRWKRLYKQRQKFEKLRTRRHIKLRFIVTFEVRNNKINMFSPKVKTRKFVYRDQHVFVFDKRCFNLDEHWGYFSQRSKGVEEMLDNGQPVKTMADYRAINGPEANNDLPRISNGERVFKEVPCEKCRNRWVNKMTDFRQNPEMKFGECFHRWMAGTDRSVGRARYSFDFVLFITYANWVSSIMHHSASDKWTDGTVAIYASISVSLHSFCLFTHRDRRARREKKAIQEARNASAW